MPSYYGPKRRVYPAISCKLTIDNERFSSFIDLLSCRLLGLTPSTQLINGFNCQSYRPFIGINTDYLCEKIPQLHVLLHQSNIQARERCQFHFRDHPWACQFSSKLTVLRRFLRQGKHDLIRSWRFISMFSSFSLEGSLVLHEFKHCQSELDVDRCLHQRSNQRLSLPMCSSSAILSNQSKRHLSMDLTDHGWSEHVGELPTEISLSNQSDEQTAWPTGKFIVGIITNEWLMSLDHLDCE